MIVLGLQDAFVTSYFVGIGDYFAKIVGKDEKVLKTDIAAIVEVGGGIEVGFAEVVGEDEEVLKAHRIALAAKPAEDFDAVRV